MNHDWNNFTSCLLLAGTHLFKVSHITFVHWFTLWQWEKSVCLHIHYWMKGYYRFLVEYIGSGQGRFEVKACLFVFYLCGKPIEPPWGLVSLWQPIPPSPSGAFLPVDSIVPWLKWRGSFAGCTSTPSSHLNGRTIVAGKVYFLVTFIHSPATTQ